MKSIEFVFVTALFIINLLLVIDCHRFQCARYSCDLSNSNGNNCSVKELVYEEKDNIIDSYVKFTLKPCLIKDEICPYTKMRNIKEVSCITPTYTSKMDLRSYPGQICNSKKLIEYNYISNPIEGVKLYNYCNRDSECDINLDKCISVAPFAACSIHHECPINYACMEEKNGLSVIKKCMPQKTLHESCTQDYHCQNNLGCDLLNFICVEYFSLKPGTIIKDSSKNIFSLCETGEVNSGVCESEVTNVNIVCPEDICIYKNDKNQEFSLPYKCKCGYDSDGRKYCSKGNNHIDLINYRKMLKTLLNSGSCHTLERRNCMKMYNFNYLKLNIHKEFEYLKFLAKYQHLFEDSEKCIKQFFFPNLQVPETDKEKYINICPKFTCDKKYKKNDSNICLVKKQLYSPNNSEYVLYGCSDPNSSCLFDYSSLFFPNNNISSITCNKQESEIDDEDSISYPGEPCNSNNDCYFQLNCLNNICYGKGFDEQCHFNIDCNAGLYCNDKENKCKYLKREESPCKDEFECMNNMGCYNNKCVLYFSLPVNTQVTPLLVKQNQNRNIEDLCEYGYIDYSANECSKISYFKTDDKIFNEEKMKNANYIKDVNLFKCNLGDTCQYFRNNNSEKFNYCICGYNKEGQGYCPYSHDDEYNWKRYFTQVRVNRNNKCHTLNRFKCKYVPKKFRDLEKSYKLKTELLPLTYGAEKCVIEEFFSDKTSYTSRSLKMSVLNFSQLFAFFLYIIIIIL